MKGYWITMEVFLALILIFLLLSLSAKKFFYQKEELRIPNLAGIGEEALTILQNEGILIPDVYKPNATDLNISLRMVLPANVFFNVRVSNQTGSYVIDIINGNPVGLTANTIFFLYGNQSLYDPRRIDLILWYEE